jgi:hypothetical protein
MAAEAERAACDEGAGHPDIPTKAGLDWGRVR